MFTLNVNMESVVMLGKRYGYYEIYYDIYKTPRAVENYVHNKY